MDYDEWTPLGRGDPLKNDPTFDYVPPVLDRVQYWLDSQSSTEASSKRDILVLGVTAKKTSPKIPEHFLKFVDGPNFQRNEGSNFRKDFIGSTGAEPPKIIRATKFRTGGSAMDLRNPNRIQSIPASYYPSPYYNDKVKPYTVMMPPPMIHKQEMNHQHAQFGVQTEESPISLLHSMNPDHHSSPVGPRPVSRPTEQTTTSTVSFDKSNLVYQSSQTFDPWSGSQSNPSINWTDDHYEEDHAVAASGNHEVVVSQNANIIVQEDSGENEQVVLGRKEIITSSNDSSVEHDEGVKMHIVMANVTQVEDTTKKVTVAVVMPTNYNEAINNSRNVGDSRIMSTTPVPPTVTKMTAWRQPGRPGPSRVFTRRPMPAMPTNMHRPKPPNQPGMMMLMHGQLSPFSGATQRHPANNGEPPRPTVGQVYNRGEPSPLAVVLRPEQVERTTTNSPTRPTTVATTTTTEAPMITSASGFTTDPIFAHYKQPAKPMHGPMYLIIQGHSKVKTYKPTVNKHGVPVEKNSINEITTSRTISKFEQFVNENTRVTPTTRRSVVENNHEVKAKEKRVGQDSLLSLVESGFSAFTAPPLSQSSSLSSELFDRSDDDFYDDLFMDNN